MTPSLDRFHAPARGVLERIPSWACELGYATVEPPLLMAAIWQFSKDVALFLLDRLGVNRDAFLQGVAGEVRRQVRPNGVRPGTATWSPDAAAILSRAAELAAEEQARAGIEHVFWALGAMHGAVRNLLRDQGVDAARLAQAVAAYREGHLADNDGRADGAPEHPALEQFAEDLVVRAREGGDAPVIGRDAEVRRILQILSRRTKNNPVLVGDPGTGKTAIVEGLAQRIVRGDVPVGMRALRIWAVDLAALVAGAGAQGEFEDRLKRVIEEATSDPNSVLFFDEMHLLMGAGRSGGAMDAANILKPALARGRVKAIGATTAEEYRQWIEKDKAFERRFQKIAVEEPDPDSALAILRGVRPVYESHHRIKILDQALVAAVRLSRRYLPERRLPDKAIDLVDEAASRMRMERASVPAEIDDLARDIRRKETERQSLLLDGLPSPRIDQLAAEIEDLRQRENTLNAKWTNERTLFEEAQRLRDRAERDANRLAELERSGEFEEAAAQERSLAELRRRIDEATAELEAGDHLLKTALDEDEILRVLAEWTGIPVQRMSADEATRLAAMEDALRGSVIGQDDALRAVAAVVRRNRLGLCDAARPIGSFLFLGPTGVGKTELGKALADFLFDSRDRIVRIDMSEYQQEYSVSRLFGAPPGYVGYGEGGQLTEAVRRRPYSVVLFDEIEKAHPKVFETLLQVLDDGRMTDGVGRTVDFRNTILILTSNLGQESILDAAGEGSRDPARVAAATEAAMALLRRHVAPEFLNRIDEIVPFLPLGRAEIRRIAELQLEALRRRLAGEGMRISFTDAVRDLVAARGYDPAYGARPVKRVVNTLVVDALGRALLDGAIDRAHPILADVDGGEVVFSQTTDGDVSQSGPLGDLAAVPSRPSRSPE